MSGVSASFALGVPVVADMSVGLTGQEATLSQGTVTLPNATAILSGLSFTASQGTAIAFSSNQVDLTGFSMSASLGTVVVPNNAAVLSGQQFESQFESIVGLGGAVAYLLLICNNYVGTLDPNDMTIRINWCII